MTEALLNLGLAVFIVYGLIVVLSAVVGLLVLLWAFKQL